jgi:ribosomal RNA assembly protein
MAEFLNEIKIPIDRIAVLIGKEGETKAHIESALKAKINVNSQEGDVQISGEDPLSMFTCVEIVKAIGRGFNPEIALNLKKIDYVLEIISINEYIKTKNDLTRLRGRVIGKEGKARRVIEDILGIDICVYGKTISLIGRGDDVAIGRRAMESLLQGSTHANVYKSLEKQKINKKKIDLRGPGGF